MGALLPPHWVAQRILETYPEVDGIEITIEQGWLDPASAMVTSRTWTYTFRRSDPRS